MVADGELTTKEAAALLGHKSTSHLIGQLLPAGLIRGRMVNGRWLIDKASVLAFKANKKPADTRAHRINLNFVSGNGRVTAAEREANRARLAEMIERAKAARLIDKDGVDRVIKRVK